MFAVDSDMQPLPSSLDRLDAPPAFSLAAATDGQLRFERWRQQVRIRPRPGNASFGLRRLHRLHASLTPGFSLQTSRINASSELLTPIAAAHLLAIWLPRVQDVACASCVILNRNMDLSVEIWKSPEKNVGALHPRSRRGMQHSGCHIGKSSSSSLRNLRGMHNSL